MNLLNKWESYLSRDCCGDNPAILSSTGKVFTFGKSLCQLGNEYSAKMYLLR